MRVILLITYKNKTKVYTKDYPLAVDEDEARSMLFRDHYPQIMKVYMAGARVRFSVDKKLDTPASV